MTQNVPNEQAYNAEQMYKEATLMSQNGPISPAHEISPDERARLVAVQLKGCHQDRWVTVKFGRGGLRVRWTEELEKLEIVKGGLHPVQARTIRRWCTAFYGHWHLAKWDVDGTRVICRRRTPEEQQELNREREER